jgi:phosphopantothenoylcysteine synthetase/decarboxylase
VDTRADDLLRGPQPAEKETTVTDGPVLYVIVCGGRPAGELFSFAEHAQRQGWNVCVVATPSGTKFLDTGRLETLTGHPVRSGYKQPDEPDVLPPADAFVVAPATFNTVNKWAQGNSDTLALGLLNEAIGLDLPIVAVPWPNVALARHPVFDRSLAELRAWGVTILYDPARLPGPDSGSGEQAGTTFPWDELRRELETLRARLS